MIHPLSPGSPFMLPHGTRIAHKLMEVIRAEYVKFSFQEVVTPILFNKDLWVQSGHWENYKDDMFLVSMGNSGPKSDNPHNQNAVERDSHNGGGGCCDHGESEEIHGIKPMNCPAHCLIFKSTDKSYRDLPLRLAEFSPLHRNEASGALSGLSRVRKFHQDDGHIFCTFDQIQSEITSTLQFIDRVYSSILRLPSYYLALATRPASNFIGELEEWDAAEAMLTKALDDSGREWTLKPEDGAFYGPKIDVMVRDALGRVHQTATVQLDFQLPQRFGLIYVDSSGTAQRPVMIHRAVLGSVERMMAMLIEHTAGKWPFWISPRQAVVIPVVMTPEVMTYAESIAEQLRTGSLSEGEIENGVRRPCYFVDMDRSDNTIKKRVLNAQKAKYNFMMVVGQEEVRDRKVSVRGRDGTQLGMKSVAEVRRMFMEFEENFE
ncbi:threonyl-tRNA synthetase [Cladochytrium replicatum]|nr:threonyl-tRNA synthetase [Cladochytrium replicatum]